MRGRGERRGREEEREGVTRVMEKVTRERGGR